MGTVNSGQETASFVARMWLEQDRGGMRAWRGHIQHVQSGKDTYFHDLSRMAEFMAGITGVEFPADTTASRQEHPGG